ncbi:MAG: hypothetical protein KBD65_01540 [Candidatus Moranbacteria bacterium]|nr:hypothetical protein [Candidatus Moranbacteria bacterium]
MLYLIRAFALCFAVLAASCATAPASPWGVMGAVNRTGQVYTIYGVLDWNDMSAVTYVVPKSCFGKKLSLSVEYRTPKGIQAGTAPFHGVHVDYEMRQGGRSHYPVDYLEDPSPNWRIVNRTWYISSDADRVVVRIGLQGAQGPMEARNIAISDC